MVVPENDPQGQISSVDLRTRKFADQMLKGRLFIGTFIEQRFVQAINAYRHVVRISKNENDFINDLHVVLKRLKENNIQGTWIGITTPEIIGAPSHYCLWIELPEEVFGTYWFKVQGIKCRKNEISLKLKSVRIIELTTSSSEPEVNESLNETPTDKLSASSLEETINNSMNCVKKSVLQHAYYIFHEVITFANCIAAVKFFSVFLITIATCAVQFGKFLGDFLLKFMRESSILINALTPIILSCINMIGKIIGGFYILLAMMWRDLWGPPKQTNPCSSCCSYRELQYKRNAIKYR